MVEVWDGVGRRWGRSGTDSEGRFSFVVAKPDAAPGEAPRLDVYVFARGLLEHRLTRIYFPGEAANGADPVLSSLPEDDRATLVAEAEDGALHFDIRMQGERATVFFCRLRRCSSRTSCARPSPTAPGCARCSTPSALSRWRPHAPG